MLPSQVFADASVALAGRAALKGILLPPERHAELTPRLVWGRVDVDPFLPSTTTDSPVVYVRCEQGRWLVDCPLCGGAQFAAREDPRFFCVSCLCEAAGAKWLPVVWPDDVDGIEAALRLRQTVNANYTPPETVADLLDENAANGLGA